MKINRFIFSAAMLAIAVIPAKADVKLNPDKQLDYCAAQVERSLQAMRRGGTIDYSMSPKDILKGQCDWNLQKNVPESWTWGFWPGILWMDYAYTKNEKVKDEAVRFTQPLSYLANREPYDHDLGFLVFLSYEKAYNATGDTKYKDAIINTARQLAKLYNPKIGTILSWPREAVGNGRYQPYNTIIDNMINLEMLFWADQHGGGFELRDIAVSHANTTLKNHFRPDFTSYHVALYDTLTGKFIKGLTNQGYSDNSVWSRGQAWAVYGYTMCYRMTKDARYLDFAQKVSDAFISRLPEDHVAYWDFLDPAIPNAPRDASASAAVASGLLELCTYLKGDAAKKYYSVALDILESLSSKQYQSRKQNTAFLMHSTGNYPINSQIDCSIIYADYYYMEALMRLKALNERGYKP